MKSPLTVLWHITKQCNMRCSYCYYQRLYNNDVDDLSLEQVNQVLHQIIENDIVCVHISGGEPFLRRDILYHMIPPLRDKKVIIDLVTNGYFVLEEDLDFLGQHKVNLTVSIDAGYPTCNNCIKGDSDTFEKTYYLIKKILQSNINFKIAVTLTQKNKDEVSKLCKILSTISNRVIIIQIHTLVSYGDDDMSMSIIEKQEVFETITDLQIKYPNLKIVINDANQSFNHDLKLRRVSEGIVINHDGEVLINPWIPISIGNIKDASIHEIWKQDGENFWNTTYMMELTKMARGVNDFGKYNNLFQKGIIRNQELKELVANYS